MIVRMDNREMSDLMNRFHNDPVIRRLSDEIARLNELGPVIGVIGRTGLQILINPDSAHGKVIAMLEEQLDYHIKWNYTDLTEKQ